MSDEKIKTEKSLLFTKDEIQTPALDLLINNINSGLGVHPAAIEDAFKEIRTILKEMSRNL